MSWFWWLIFAAFGGVLLAAAVLVLWWTFVMPYVPDQHLGRDRRGSGR